jgi:anti-sigma factor RsiW
MSLFTPQSIPCQEIVEIITDYLEGNLSRRDRRRFDHHIAGCEHCTAYLEQMRETLRLTGRLVPEDLTPAMQSEFEALYRRWQEN